MQGLGSISAHLRAPKKAGVFVYTVKEKKTITIERYLCVRRRKKKAIPTELYLCIRRRKEKLLI